MTDYGTNADGSPVISIHTPARGVTCYATGISRQQAISIHTPARGVTVFTPDELGLPADFNPHSRTGSDIVVTYENYKGGTFQSTLPHGE